MPKRQSLTESTQDVAESFIRGSGRPDVRTYRKKDVQKSSRVKMTFSIEPQLRKRLKFQAVEEDREMSDIIADALAHYLDQHPQKQT